MIELSQHETSWLQNEGKIMLMTLGIKQDFFVIDFGCGQGRYSIPLAQVVGTNGKVYAFERDNDAIAIVQERLPLFSSNSKVEFITKDTEEIATTIAVKSIDSILIFDVLQYIQDWDLFFLSISKVLKNGGFIHIYPAAIPHPGDVNIDLAISKLEAMGYTLTNTREFRMMHSVDMVDDMVYSFCLQ